MRPLSHNISNINRNIGFGAKLPNSDDVAASRRFANCIFDNLWDRLSDSIKKTNPDLIKKVNGVEYIPDDSFSRRAVSSLKSFFGMPLDIVDFIAKKFPNSALNNSEFLQKYRDSVQFEDNVRALQGLQKNAASYAKESMQKNQKFPTGKCDHECRSICDSVSNKFLKELNRCMGDDISKYDTKKERFSTRIISGFTAALFLGNDFYNKAVQKGKTKEEAAKEQHLKQGQEIKENICEAITQFAVFACFSKTINKSPWAPAIIGALIGLVSRVVSRLTSGMRITRMDVEPNSFKSNMLSMNEFMESAKTGNVDGLLNQKQQEYIEKTKKESKKPVLSLKNILLLCAASIMGGYALRFGKNHTKIGKDIAEMIKNHSEKLKPEIIEKIYAEPEKLNKMADILENGTSAKRFAYKIKKITSNPNNTEKILLGEDYKTTKLFGRIEVKIKDLKDLKTAPLRFLKELVSYPYKIATRLEDAIKKSKISKSGGALPEKSGGLSDVHDIKNLYKRFLEFEAKSKGDNEKLAKEFGEYAEKMILKANNEVTSSKGDNSKIAVMAQTLGTLTGMWFNMNDEFNSSVRNGSTKQEAEKDARLRGLNKFFRMTVQVIISKSLNDIFQKQYNSSIASSALVVAASTVLTDMASRALSGMPNRKMTKEELEQYQKEHKEGIMSWYYKLIDKLAS